VVSAIEKFALEERARRVAPLRVVLKDAHLARFQLAAHHRGAPEQHLFGKDPH